MFISKYIKELIRLQNMNEVKIQIPDNCELIKNGNMYIVKEKKQEPPKTWEEFCERYPVKNDECFITPRSSISSKEDYKCDSNRHCIEGRNWCTSIEEAEAFLALIQLRQLRKAWVGDWEPSRNVEYSVILVEKRTNRLKIGYGYWEYNYLMTFPSKKMAYDFLECFRDLCETAKILL